MKDIILVETETTTRVYRIQAVGVGDAKAVLASFRREGMVYVDEEEQKQKIDNRVFLLKEQTEKNITGTTL